MEAAPLMSSAQADTRATWEACACMYMQAHKQTLDGETYLQTAARGMGRGREPLHLCSRVYFDPAVVFVFLFLPSPLPHHLRTDLWNWLLGTNSWGGWGREAGAEEQRNP